MKGKIGRPKLNIDYNTLKSEIDKYISKEQTGVDTYTNLGIGKTSFYAILKNWKNKNNV